MSQFEHLRDLPNGSLTKAEVGILLDRIADLIAAHEAKVDDLRRETLRSATARALAARLWRIVEVEAPQAAAWLVKEHGFAPPDELALFDELVT